LQEGGGGGTFDDMEARVARLEKDMGEVRSDLKAVRVDIAEIKGKLSNMPTTFQLIGLVLAIMAATFAIVRLGGAG
jgi:hypothetical protein